MEKESSRGNLNEEHPLAEISQSLDQVLILFEQLVNTCSYVQRFKIVIAFINNRKKVETTRILKLLLMNRI